MVSFIPKVFGMKHRKQANKLEEFWSEQDERKNSVHRCDQVLGDNEKDTTRDVTSVLVDCACPTTKY